MQNNQQLEIITDDEEVMVDALTIEQSQAVQANMPVLALGEHYVSDFIDPHETSATRKKYSLDLYIEPETGAVRLRSEDLPPADAMWGRYWYRSGTNATMTKELGNIVAEVTDRINYKPGDIWLDIACNDGTLLKQVPADMVKVGIDPCDDSYLQKAANTQLLCRITFQKRPGRSQVMATKKPRSLPALPCSMTWTILAHSSKTWQTFWMTKASLCCN